MWVRLQRVLPVRRSFLQAVVLRSTIRTLAPLCAANIEAKRPAGPAPVMQISVFISLSIIAQTELGR